MHHYDVGIIYYVLFVATANSIYGGRTHTNDIARNQLGQCSIDVKNNVLSSSSPDFTIPCQVAAFGEYIPVGSEYENIKWATAKLAHDSNMNLCSPIEQASIGIKSGLELSEKSIIVVHRGVCTFQEKLRNAVNAGATGIILVNTENSLLQLGSLEHEDLAGIAVSVASDNGNKLIRIIQEQSSLDKERVSAIEVAIRIDISLLNQSLQRLEYLLVTNAPYVAFQTYYTFLRREAREALGNRFQDLDTMLAVILSKEQKGFREVESNDLDWVVYFHEVVRIFSSSSHDFAGVVSLHAAVSSIMLLPTDETLQIHTCTQQSCGTFSPRPSFYNDVRILASQVLLQAGFYQHSKSCIESIIIQSSLHPSKISDLRQLYSAKCEMAFIQFLQGDLKPAIEQTKFCMDIDIGMNMTVNRLNIPMQTLKRLAVYDLTLGDIYCLQQATGIVSSSYKLTDIQELLDENISINHFPRVESDVVSHFCCKRRVQPREKDAKAHPIFFSPFVDELYQAITIMAVYLDELGSFNESLRYLNHASRLCPDDSVHFDIRLATSVPIVFQSTQDIVQFYDDIQPMLLRLAQKSSHYVSEESILSSMAGHHQTSAKLLYPEDAPYYTYTITPTTMFIGYQGNDVKKVKRQLHDIYEKLFPSLTTIDYLQQYDRSNILSSSEFRQSKPQFFNGYTDSRKKRIGFISSWFRNHSVGKLMLGVLQNLDRTKFHIAIYRCTHFKNLRYPDELTIQFRQLADSYKDLPSSRQDSIALILSEKLDVIVYPELGMDAWLVFLSHMQLAPTQCVFWGHPITTGNPRIQYFISSKYYHLATNSDSTTANDTSASSSSGTKSYYQTYQDHEASFTEQVVLFDSLGIYFKKPSTTDASRQRVWTRSMMHLPAINRLYVCPQTLMKLHPEFDNVLQGILTQDPLSIIVLLKSPTQNVWKEQLRQRFRRVLKENHTRVIFMSTMPYDDFLGLLSLSDAILDPFPFGGGVTTLDALAVGTPVITIPSKQSVVQLAAGFLQYMNITQSITSSVEEYVKTAIELATPSNSRAVYQQLLKERYPRLFNDKQAISDWNDFLTRITNL